MSHNSEDLRVRAALKSLEKAIDAEYAIGQLREEAEIEAVIRSHLQQRRPGLQKWRLDVVVCRVALPSEIDSYNPSRVVAVIEIKYNSDVESDLKKLNKLLEHFRNNNDGHGILAWMVYGVIFRPEVHKAKCCKEIEKRALPIEEWAAEDEEHRGHTILRLGHGRRTDKYFQRQIRIAFNEKWWRDKKSNTEIPHKLGRGKCCDRAEHIRFLRGRRRLA